jgi:hypothetical protein
VFGQRGRFFGVVFEQPPHVDHKLASRILRAALAGEVTDPPANEVLVGLAMFDSDRGFVEDWCVRIGRSAPDLWLRGLASLCVASHLARRFGVVSEEAVSLVRELAVNNEMRAINPQVLDALDDLEQFVG